MAGRVSLKRLEIYDVELRLSLRPNGSLALPVSPEKGDVVDLTPPLRSAGSPDGALSSPEAPPALRGDTGEPQRVPPGSQFAAMLRLAIDTLTSPDSVT